MPCSTTVGWPCALFYPCKVCICALFYCCKVCMCALFYYCKVCARLVLPLLVWCMPCSTTVRWSCALFYYCMVGVYLVLLL